MSSKSPVYKIKAVPIEKINPNSYNPNSVAPPEMRWAYLHQALMKKMTLNGYFMEAFFQLRFPTLR